MKFDERELEIVRYARLNPKVASPIFKYPVTEREGWKSAVLDRKPHWFCTGTECVLFYPDVIPDNRARGFSNDGGKPLALEEKGGRDMFGIDWIFTTVANGSIENPEYPHLLEDANDWEKCIVWPDLDAWDWKGSAERNREFLDTDSFNSLVFLNGFGFERLVSFMGFENAAMAMVDPDQEDALIALLDKVSDLACRLIDKCCEHYNIHGFTVHDDWGSQRAPLFSVEAGRKFFVPNMKKIVDHIHSKGMVAELHSCGHNEPQVPNFIEAGWDMWNPMASINDTQKLHELYGDKLIIGVFPETYDAEKDSEEVIRGKARAFVEKFCSDPSRICVLNKFFFFAGYLQGVYAEELYKASREKYEYN